MIDQAEVTVTVYRIDLADIRRPGEKLITFKSNLPDVFEQVRAWAQVRGYSRAVQAIDNASTVTEPPESGFHVTINKTSSLLIFARWPWYDPAMFPSNYAQELRWLLRAAEENS